MFDPPIITIGTLTEAPEDKVYCVTLPNGKTVVGHLPKALMHLHDVLRVGDRVKLELTPFDFTKARIVEIVSD